MLRVHRTSMLILALVVAVAVAAFTVASSVRDDNERHLLGLQADQVAQLLDSLASGQKVPVQTAAVLAAQDNDGDFTQAVSVATGQLWAVLHRNGSDVSIDQVVGGAAADVQPTITGLDSSAQQRLTDAFNGQFVVLGIFGSGLNKRIAMAAGDPGGGDTAAYTEVSLFASAAGAGTTTLLSDIDLALYVSQDLTDENLVLTTTQDLPIKGLSVTRTVNIGEMPVTYVLHPRSPLSGSFATRTPWLLALLVLGLGALVVFVMELNLRKRDHALELVSDRDRALLARDEADAGRAKVEADLRQAQRLEAVGQLAGGIAHDFNNLLAAIVSFADLLTDELPRGQARADLDEIRSAARRGAALTRQLLQFSSRETGQSDRLDVNLVIGDLERLLARTLGEEIELQTELADDLPTVPMSVTELEQVVMNLVVNARDAVDGPGRVTISTEVLDVTDEVRVQVGAPALATGTYVRLSVTDDGAGMSPETVARAFEPFFTTKDRGRGTGLGLATVYGIVQRTGGHVSVESNPGEGTTFEVLLPTEPAAAPAAAIPEPPRAVAGAGQIVLLVEDEEAVRRATSRMLRKWGYEVVEAIDGVDALAKAAGTDFDLLLTDVIMPGGLTGKDVAERLKAERPALPVVFMSGYSAGVLERRGLGGDEADTVVVSKPFIESQLRVAVADALSLTCGGV